MPDSHFGHRPADNPLPEVPAEGLVLWRLHSYDDEWWCTVEAFANRLMLRVHTPDDSRIALTETFDTASAVVTRADELCAQYLTQGWNLREADARPTPSEASPMMTLWFVADGSGWAISGVQCESTSPITPAAIMNRPPLGRLLPPALVATVHDALRAAAAGERPVLYFKAIRDTGIEWRRGVLTRDADRVRMEVFETIQAIAMNKAVEVDLRA